MPHHHPIYRHVMACFASDLSFGLWMRLRDSPSAALRRQALAAKTRSVINYDRVLRQLERTPHTP